MIYNPSLARVKVDPYAKDECHTSNSSKSRVERHKCMDICYQMHYFTAIRLINIRARKCLLSFKSCSILILPDISVTSRSPLPDSFTVKQEPSSDDESLNKKEMTRKNSKSLGEHYFYQLFCKAPLSIPFWLMLLQNFYRTGNTCRFILIRTAKLVLQNGKCPMGIFE